MIETTIREVGGVRFYENIRILEPDYKKFGIGLHWISDKLLMRGDTEFLRYIKAVGLRQVEHDPSMRACGYALYPMSYWRFKVVEFLFKCYWWSIRWVYDNARFFKQIPAGECFSWRYFTPYIWYKKMRGK